MSWLTRWWKVRRLEQARKLLAEHGLVAVRIRVVAGSTYIETVDGQLLKVGAQEKKA